MLPWRNLLYSSCQILDQALCTVGGIFHRDHSSALLAGFGIQQHLIDVNVEIMRKQIAENGLRTGLKQRLGNVGWQCPLRISPLGSSALDLAHGKKFNADRILGQCIDETGRDDPHLIHLSFQKEIAGKGGDRSGFRELWCVGVGKFGKELAARAGNKLRSFPAGSNKDR